MDVLEHCSDDAAVLREVVDHLAPGGALFVTVPAFRRLWSSHDVFLKHYRRYNCDDLRALLAREPRLELVHLHYFYGLLFPAACHRWAQRGDNAPRSSQLRKMPALMNWLLLSLCRLETVFMRRNRLAGLSVVGVCRRRGAPAPSSVS